MHAYNLPFKIMITYADFAGMQPSYEAEAAVLKKCFEDSNVQVEVLPVPFLLEPADRILQQLVAYRLLAFTHYPDCLLCLGNPVQALRHPNKIVWLERVNFFSAIAKNLAWIDSALLSQTLADASLIVKNQSLLAEIDRPINRKDIKFAALSQDEAAMSDVVSNIITMKSRNSIASVN